jgi:hypothetical protein
VPNGTDMHELEAALREISPRPDDAFAQDLGRRVEAGFSRPERRRWRPPLMPALAAASVLIVLAVAGVVVLGGSSEKSEGGMQLSSAPPPRREALTAGGADTAATPAQRRVERSIRLTIAAAHGKLPDLASGVGEAAAAHGGYVLSSNVSSGAGDRSGLFTLRIPSAQLESALADLSALGDVRERSETSQDLTAPFGRVQDRLGNALLERRETAARLRTASGAEAERLRSRLRAVTAEIRSLSGQLHTLRRRTAMSTVNVQLEEKGAKHQGGIAGGGPGAALDDALAVLAGAFNVAIRALPLALLVLGGWLGWAALRRRRREAALF